MRTLLAQRVYALALGYEDLNDHDQLRGDALLSLAAGKVDPTGAGRVRERDRGVALASSSTLNRLELDDPEQAGAHRYKRIVAGRWKTMGMVNRYGERLLPNRRGAAQLGVDSGRRKLPLRTTRCSTGTASCGGHVYNRWGNKSFDSTPKASGHSRGSRRSRSRRRIFS